MHLNLWGMHNHTTVNNFVIEFQSVPKFDRKIQRGDSRDQGNKNCDKTWERKPLIETPIQGISS